MYRVVTLCRNTGDIDRIGSRNAARIRRGQVKPDLARFSVNSLSDLGF